MTFFPHIITNSALTKGGIITVFAMLLFGCSVTPIVQQENENAAFEKAKTESNNNAIAHLAEQFGQNLAKHILNHPNIADNIHCATIPSNNSHPTNGSMANNESDDTVSEKQLCTLEVVEYEPELITLMSFFVKSGHGDITVIDSFDVEGESTLGRIGFSEHGKYFYLVKTDEGHPWFTFFDTQKFLTNYMYAGVGEVFEEYYLDHIESFYDNGDIVFAIIEDTIMGCLSGEIEIEPKTKSTDEVKRCLFHYNIFDKYNSFGSSDPYVPTRSKRRIQMPYVCKAFQ